MTPAGGLVDNQFVTVDGTGFPTGEFVGITQCPTGSEAFERCRWGTAYTPVDGTGALSTLTQVSRILQDEFGLFPAIDCATPGACALQMRLLGGDGTVIASVGLDFAPGPPPPPPAFTLSASTGLSDGQAITVTGSGWQPARPIIIGQCTLAVSQRLDCGPAVSATPDLDGNFTTTLTVARGLIVNTGVTTMVDCATAGACGLIAGPNWWREGRPPSAEVPITVTDGPLPIPGLLVTPSSGLVDGQAITVESVNEPPQPQVIHSAGIFVRECRAGYSGYDDLDTCMRIDADNGDWIGSPTATGRRWELQAVRHLDTPSGPVDCGVEACVVVYGQDWFALVSDPISFATGQVTPAFTG